MKILVCDDHALFREGLRLVLRDVDPDAEILEAAEGEEALSIIASNNEDIDLLLLDLNMPGMDGWISLRQLRSRYPAIPVAIVSASEKSSDVQTALDGGASGFIPKSARGADLVDALKRILDGEVYVPPSGLGGGARREESSSRLDALTSNEREVLALLSQGKTSREIGEQLGLPEEEVASRVASVLGTLDIKAAN